MSDLETFRAETRAWLEANCPPEMREPMRDESDACWGGRNPTFKNEAPEGLDGRDGRARLDRARLAEGIWRRRLSPAETKILKQEMARIGARNPLMSFGISMLGPALARNMAARSRRMRYLPEIARGEIRWCQGYSGARRRLRPRLPADQMRGQGRSLAGQRPEGLDQLCRQGRLDLLPGPHRSRSAQASGDQLPPVRHGEPGRLDQADPAHLRQFALLRDLLRRREGAQGPAGRRRSTRAGTSPNICSATSAR